MQDYEKDGLNQYGKFSRMEFDNIFKEGENTQEQETEEAFDLTVEGLEDMPNEEKPKQTFKESLISIITTQSIICVVILILLILLKFLSSDTAQNVQESFASLYEKDVNWEELTNDYKTEFTNFINQLTPIQNTDSDASKDTSSTDHQSSENTNSENIESNDTSQTTNGGDPTDSEAVMGGELQVRYPPADATFAPVSFEGDTALPLQGSISSSFGYREDPITKELSFHKGIDILGNEGDGIAAFAEGTVTTAQASDSYGNYVIIQHDSTFSTLYAHCSKLLVQKGNHVSKGQIIAEVGSTGKVTGSHLHFEAIKGGLRVNPDWLLAEILYA